MDARDGSTGRVSGKSKQDYHCVLEAVKDLVSDGICIEGVVADFESSLWQAVKIVFPNAKIHGCVFHWTQAVWRKV